jgi:NTE family protein
VLAHRSEGAAGFRRRCIKLENIAIPGLGASSLGYRLRVPRVGLCLGAGGLVGQAYHAGVLAALQVDLGWDARDADIVVGTSAGSLTGTMLRMGTSPFDLASWVLGRPWSPDQTFLDGLDALRSGLPLVKLRTLLRPWHIPALGTWIPIGGRPWAFRPLAMLA